MKKIIMLILLVLLPVLNMAADEINWESLATNNKEFQKVMFTVEGKLVQKTKALEEAVNAYTECEKDGSDDCQGVLKAVNQSRLDLIEVIESGVVVHSIEQLNAIKKDIVAEKNNQLGYEDEINLSILNDDFEINEDVLLLLDFLKDLDDLKNVIEQKKKELNRLKRYLYVSDIKESIRNIKRLMKNASKNTNFKTKVDTKAVMKRLLHSGRSNRIASKYGKFSEKTF